MTGFERGLGRMAAIFVLALTVADSAWPVCPAGLDRTTPDAEFVNNGDGTILHQRTGLTWKRCLEGDPYCSGTIHSYTWAEAFGTAAAANVEAFGGYDDWRLPSVIELQSIVESGCYMPSINELFFPGIESAVGALNWTSTTVTGTPYLAWGVDFQGPGLTTVDKINSLTLVRLVRGGQSFAAFDSIRNGCTLDVDGNGTQDALTDGVIILRALMGLTGTGVTSGIASGSTALRPTWAQIRLYLNGKCWGNFAP